MNEFLLAATRLELLRTDKVSVTELAEAHICQIERLNPSPNALVGFDLEECFLHSPD